MREPIEPQLERYASSVEEYLKGGPDYVQEMTVLINSLGEDWSQTELSPRILGDISCHLVVRGRNYTDGKIEIELAVIPDRKDRYNGVNPGIIIAYNKRFRLVTGAISNRTNQVIGGKDKIELPPLRNVSGILAPYEDAFCQAIANKTKKPVRRTVSTEKGPDSRLVTNYLKRGYSQRPESDETFQSLFRDFLPE